MRPRRLAAGPTGRRDESATWRGRGVGGVGLASRRRPAGEHERGVQAGAARAGDVGVEPVADGQHAAGAEAVERGRRTSAARACRRCVGACGRWRSRSPPAPRRCPATGRRASGSWASRVAPISSAPRSTAWVAISSSSKAKLVVAADDDDVGAGGEARAVDDPQAGVGDVVDQRLRADDVRRAAAVALGEQVLQGGADAQRPRRPSLEAEPPQLAHEPLGRVAHVVGEEQDRLPASRSAATASTAPGSASSPTQTQPSRSSSTWSYGGRRGRAARAPSLSLPAVPRLLAVLIACCRPARRRLRRRLGATSRPPRRRAERPTATPRTVAPERLREGRAAGAQGRGKIKKPKEKLDPSQDLRRDGVDQLRRLRDHARRQARAEHRRLVQVPGRQEVLRRPDLPPDRRRTS